MPRVFKRSSPTDRGNFHHHRNDDNTDLGNLSGDWRDGVEQQSGPQGYETEIPTLSPIRFPALYATVTSKFSHDPLHRNIGFTSPNVTSTYSRCPRRSLCPGRRVEVPDYDHRYTGKCYANLTDESVKRTYIVIISCPTQHRPFSCSYACDLACGNRAPRVTV